jgi:hypothetical protein
MSGDQHLALLGEPDMPRWRKYALLLGVLFLLFSAGLGFRWLK